MNRVGLLAILIAAACFNGCDNKSSLTPASGSGGATAAGGAVGSGGLPAALGSGGAGGMALPDDAACSPGFAYQRVTPWELQPNQGGSKGTAADGSFSGCVESLNDTSCSGPAWLGGNGQGGAGGASVTWDDSSRLTWQPYAADPSATPPIAPGAPERRIWAAFRGYSGVGTALCGGGNNITTVELRDAPNGNVLLMSRDLDGTAAVTAADVAAVFGVVADPLPSCKYDTVENCNTVHETLNDHILQTDPPQRIPYGSPVQVTAPTGTFSVIWYSRSEGIGDPVTHCSCSAVANPHVSFFATRVAGP